MFRSARVSLLGGSRCRPSCSMSRWRGDPPQFCLSFGDPEPFAPKIHAANIPSDLSGSYFFRTARRAAEVGATVIVGQGTEAGGHGASRSVSTLVPEIADLLARSFPELLLCAAGGIADGRDLQPLSCWALMECWLASRLWASAEANVHPNFHARSSGCGWRCDDLDERRGCCQGLSIWPTRYTARVLRNRFVDTMATARNA